MMFDIELARALCAGGAVLLTKHAANRLRERGIMLRDIRAAIMNGQIIEEYPDDYPYPSALVYGKAANNQPLHAVVGVGDGQLWYITAYWPTLERWKADYMSRKAVE